MIRFACPGCSSTFTVDADKAGKPGKCPKCAAEFVIPDTPTEAPATPPAAAAAEGTTEVDPCPKCGTRLSVASADVGRDVECPYCQSVFRAKAPGSGRPLLSPSKRPRREPDDAEDDRPRSRRRPIDDDEDDDRPSRRRRRDDDDDYDRPRRSRRRYSDVESKRVTAGILALLLGSFGVHKFYLGYTGAGCLHLLLLFLTCGGIKFVALAEGIIYLTKSDDEFIETYQIGRKEWF